MMFNNLIESSSHRKEYKRRGSFLLLTTITYALLLSITGVASIYAYDARLEDQIYEQVITMLPPEPVPVTPTTPTPSERPPTPDRNRSTLPERAVAMSNVNQPHVVPEGISAAPNKVQPLPDGPVRITGRDWNPMPTGGSGSSGTGSGTRIVPSKPIILDDDPPPLPPPPPANKIVKISKVLNSQAIFLPRPTYPILAKQIRLQGTVTIQVLIDETGKVISAQAIGGPPMLVPEAKKAAMQARFSPTIIGEQPVKVSGVITYNFILQ